MDVRENYIRCQLCVNLDLDRQSFPFLTPGKVPLRNIEALCAAFEDFCYAP